MPESTWKPHQKHGRLTTQSDLPDSVFAFPKQRKEPLTDAQHVRNAVARFDHPRRLLGLSAERLFAKNVRTGAQSKTGLLAMQLRGAGKNHQIGPARGAELLQRFE